MDACNCENTGCPGNHFTPGDSYMHFTRCPKPAGKAVALWVGPLCDDCAAHMPRQYMAALADGTVL